MQAPSPEQAAQTAELSAAGWTFMLASLGFVWGLTLLCFRKVLAGPSQTPGPVKDFHSA